MTDYFISYASDDRPRAVELVDALEELGAKCFIDCRDIPSGVASYREELLQGIATCEAIVVLLSDYSQASDEVFREVQVAHNRGRRRIGVWLGPRGDFTNATLEFLLTSTQDIEWMEQSAQDIAQRVRATSTVSSLRAHLTQYQSVVDRLQIDLSQIFAAADRGDIASAILDVHGIAISILKRLWEEYGVVGDPPSELRSLLLGCRDYFAHQSLLTNFAAISTAYATITRKRPTMDVATKSIESLMSVLSVLRAHRWGMHDLTPSLRSDAIFLSGLLIEVGWLQGSELVPRSDVVYLLFERPGRNSKRYLEIVLGDSENAISGILDESSGRILPELDSPVTTRFLVLAGDESWTDQGRQFLSPEEFIARFTGLIPLPDLHTMDYDSGATQIANTLSSGTTNVLYYGPPGTGKSTSLKTLAEKGWVGAPQFRFLVDYADSDRLSANVALEQQLGKRFPAEVQPRVREIVAYLVRTGRAALLLDSIECAAEFDQPLAASRTFARLCAFLSQESIVVMAGRDAALRDSPTVREFFLKSPALNDVLVQTLRSNGVDAATLPGLKMIRARHRPRWTASSPRDRLIQVLSNDIWHASEQRACSSLASVCPVEMVADATTMRALTADQIRSLSVGSSPVQREGLDLAGLGLHGVEDVRVLRELRAAIGYLHACTFGLACDNWVDAAVGETTRRLVRLLSNSLPESSQLGVAPLAMVGPPNSVFVVRSPKTVNLALDVVTVGQFREFLGALPSLPSLDDLTPELPDEGQLLPMYERVPNGLYRDKTMDDLPAVGVSWWAADSFARWAGSRLPTSLEWEVAGRGWDGRIFPWGDAPLPSATHCADSSAGKPLLDYSTWREAMRAGDVAPRGARQSITGTLNVSPNGQREMSGNTWEWLATGVGRHKIIAGGSYDNPLRACVLSSRGVADPSTRSNAVGFRLVESR